MSVIKVVSSDTVVTGKRVRLHSLSLLSVIDPAVPETADMVILVRDGDTLGAGEVIARLFAARDTTTQQQLTFDGAVCLKGIVVELAGPPHADFTLSVEFA